MLSRKYQKGIDTNFFNKKNLDILEYIRMRAYYLYGNYYDSSYFDKMYCITECKSFINEFFNGKQDLNFQKFLSKAETCYPYDCESNYDGMVAGDYTKKRVYKIELPEIYDFESCSIVIHEFIHYLFFLKAPKSCYRKEQDEIITILMEKIFADYCLKNNIFKDNDILLKKKESSILTYITQYDESFLEYVNKDIYELVTNFFDEDNPMFMMSHFIGEIYSNRLFEKYLDDENKLNNQIRGLFSGNNVDDLLSYYDVDLQDNKTIDATVKTITQIEKQNLL